MTNTDPHERHHTAITESLALWLSANSKGNRTEAQRTFKSTITEHLENYHGYQLSVHDASPYDLIRLHEGYHEDDDIQD